MMIMMTTNLVLYAWVGPRGGASFEKVGRTGGRIYCQKMYLMIFISFLLWNKC